MSKRLTSFSQLRHGQKVVCLEPTVIGTVKVEYEQQQQGQGGWLLWTKVPKPANPRPDVRKTYALEVCGKPKDTRNLSQLYLKDGILVSDGPCKKCRGDGLLRNKATGEHKLCGACFDWL